MTTQLWQRRQTEAAAAAKCLLTTDTLVLLHGGPARYHLMICTGCLEAICRLIQWHFPFECDVLWGEVWVLKQKKIPKVTFITCDQFQPNDQKQNTVFWPFFYLFYFLIAVSCQWIFWAIVSTGIRSINTGPWSGLCCLNGQDGCLPTGPGKAFKAGAAAQLWQAQHVSAV